MVLACAVLEIAPSTYYAAKKREGNPSARDERDEEMKKEIQRVWNGNGRRRYGAKKVWLQLNREGIEVARCTVERLMRELGIGGIAPRRKRPRTTVPAGPGGQRPSDLLGRDFTADGRSLIISGRNWRSTRWKWQSPANLRSIQTAVSIISVRAESAI